LPSCVMAPFGVKRAPQNIWKLNELAFFSSFLVIKQPTLRRSRTRRQHRRNRSDTKAGSGPKLRKSKAAGTVPGIGVIIPRPACKRKHYFCTAFIGKRQIFGPPGLDNAAPNTVTYWGVYSWMIERGDMTFTRSEAGKLGYDKTQEHMVGTQEHMVGQCEKRKAIAMAAYESHLPHCAFCDAVLPYENRRNKFCNHSCAASYTNLGVAHNPRKTERRTHCLRCGQPVKGTGRFYCSRSCSHAHRLERFAEKLTNGRGHVIW
jgi:hypothetical protein